MKIKYFIQQEHVASKRLAYRKNTFNINLTEGN